MRLATYCEFKFQNQIECLLTRISQQEQRLVAGLPGRKSDHETLEKLKSKIRTLEEELSKIFDSQNELTSLQTEPKCYEYLLDLPEDYPTQSSKDIFDPR